MLKRSPILLAAVFLGLISRSAWCYGPLNHFCVVAQNWDDIRPLIERLVGHPLSATEESDARRAALVGAFSLDLGYWPPSNQPQVLLTKASHYARTGEWAAFLLREAQNQKDPEAFAFALGALSHYAADRMGHYFGTNAAAVRLAHREDSFGARMSYDRDHSMHTVVEAGFDMFSASTGCASLGA